MVWGPLVLRKVQTLICWDRVEGKFQSWQIHRGNQASRFVIGESEHVKQRGNC